MYKFVIRKSWRRQDSFTTHDLSLYWSPRKNSKSRLHPHTYIYFRPSSQTQPPKCHTKHCYKLIMHTSSVLFLSFYLFIFIRFVCKRRFLFLFHKGVIGHIYELDDLLNFWVFLEIDFQF